MSIASAAGMVDQTQVVVANTFLNLSKLPRSLLSRVCAELGDLYKDVRPASARAAAHLLRISGNTVKMVVNKMML